MGWSTMESLKRFSPWQAALITMRETAFVGGLGAAEEVAVLMRHRLGNHKAVDYAAAYVAGYTASMAGYPADTLLTLFQCKMPLKHYRQLIWGACRKARATGWFSLVYKLGKDVLNSGVQPSAQ